MITLDCGRNRQVVIDDDGFLLYFDDWDEGVACVLAEREGITELTPERMDILRFLRDYYAKHRFFPVIRSVCKSVGQTKGCMDEKFMEPVKAWRIAGLPNPGDEVIGFGSWDPLGT